MRQLRIVRAACRSERHRAVVASDALSVGFSGQGSGSEEEQPVRRVGCSRWRRLNEGEGGAGGARVAPWVRTTRTAQVAVSVARRTEDGADVVAKIRESPRAANAGQAACPTAGGLAGHGVAADRAWDGR